MNLNCGEFSRAVKEAFLKQKSKGYIGEKPVIRSLKLSLYIFIEEVLSYRTIEEVYKRTVVIKKNPVSSNPYCFLVSREEKERRLNLWKEKD